MELNTKINPDGTTTITGVLLTSGQSVRSGVTYTNDVLMCMVDEFNTGSDPKLGGIQ